MGCIGSLIQFDPIDEKRIHDFDTQHCVIQLEKGLLPANLRTLIAQFQVRRPEASGGLGITSMEAIQAPAFYSATFRFFRSEKMLTFLADNPDITSTSHSQHLTTWFREVSLHLESLGIPSVHMDPNAQPRDRSPCLPDLKLVFSGADLTPVSRAAALALNQHALTVASKTFDPTNAIFQGILEVSPRDRSRISHLSQVLLKGRDPRLPVDPDRVIKFTPMAVFTRFHSLHMTRYQLMQVLRLYLGLPIPPPQQVCRCSTPLSSDGTHLLTCTQWAAHGWTHGHDAVMQAILFETKLAGLQARGEGTILDRLHQRIPTHLTSRKRGDFVVQANTAFQVKDTISDLQQEYRQFVADVRIGAPFKGTGE